jgi:hypothetical protein
MISPDYSSCVKNCSMSNGFSSQYSPKCTIIKRCTSPKPPPVPGCKWVKRCSPTLDDMPVVNGEDDMSVVGGGVYPLYRRRRHHFGSPFLRRRHHFGHRISPFATTAIGHGNHMRGRMGWGSPMRRHYGGMGSPFRGGMVGRKF